MKRELYSIDLYSGCGGLTEGLKKAGFTTKYAVEIDDSASDVYELNHPKVELIRNDIRKVDTQNLDFFAKRSPDLIAGCPPCQGFSSLRRLNKRHSVRDSRNALIIEYMRFIDELRPLTIMLENVPGLTNYYHFRKLVRQLQESGYNPKYEILNVKDYGVPQNRKRLVLIGSRIGDLDIAKGSNRTTTVRKMIGKLPSPEESNDELHKIVANHTPRIKKMISLIPKDGGSRKDLPLKYTLDCHKKEGIGFNDVYGRLKWDGFSTTITGGCLNPSKGRFLHPSEDRVITPREASLLQSFPKNYKFLTNIPKASLALMIGNALPPKFSYYQSINIKKHIIQNS